MNKKKLKLFCTNACNNNCVMCSTKGMPNDQPTFSEIKKIINQAKKNNYQVVSLLGGEPTMRADLQKIIRHAKLQGCHIQLNSNCRKMSYAHYTKKIADAGLIQVTTSLHGHNKRLHNSITRTPGSFIQTVNGINNLIQNNVEIIVNIVILKQNLSYLKDIMAFLKSQGVRRIHLINVAPVGNEESLNSTAKLVDVGKTINTMPELVKQYLPINKNTKIFKNKNQNQQKPHLIIFDVPFCIVGPKYHKFLANLQGHKKHAVCGLSKFTTLTKQKKIKPKKCINCRHYISCEGIWESHYRKFGAQEINPII